MRKEHAMPALMTGFGILLAIGAALLIMDVRRAPTICASCGLLACDGESCAARAEWDERTAAAMSKIERNLAAMDTADTLEPWRELLESLR